MRVVAAIRVKGGNSNCTVRAAGPFADDDIEDARFHRGVEDFFDSAIEAMDLVDEKHVAGGEVGEDRREIADALDRGAGSGAQARADLFGDQMRERGLAQSGRTIQKYVLGLMVAAARGGQKDAQILFYRRLADIFGPRIRPQCLVQRARALFDGVFCLCLSYVVRLCACPIGRSRLSTATAERLLTFYPICYTPASSDFY